MGNAKVIASAIVAAAVLLAVAEVGEASAAPSKLCKMSSNPCPAGSTWASGAVLKGTAPLKLAFPKSGWSNFECPSATIEVKTTATSGEPLPGELTSLALKGECKFGNGGGACGLSVANLPWSTGMAAVAGGNGSLTWSAGKSGAAPGLTLECTVIKCPYSNPTGTSSFTGGTAPVLSGAVPMNTLARGCPNEAVVEFEFVLNEAFFPVFLTH